MSSIDPLRSPPSRLREYRKLRVPFADVWRTRNGRRSELVNPNAWLPRSGHKSGVLRSNIVCFGSFNSLGNPVDVQTSPDGVHWAPLDPPASPPWHASSPTETKCDFDIVVNREGSGRFVIYSLGGDRETLGGPPPEPLQPEEDL